MLIELLIPAGVMGALGLALATALLLAAKRFYVYEDPRIDVIEDILPSANCGGCGKAGCRAFAECLVKGEEGLRCPVCSEDATAKIAEVLGQELSTAEPLVAHVMCEGLQSSAVFRGRYRGIEDCRAAHLVGQVEKVCSYGCIGLGTCLDACAFDAIEVFDGIAHVIPENCVACGKCVEVCPRELIELIPKGRRVFVPCKSRDAGKVVTKVCETGCIGCKKCLKACPSGAIGFDDNLAWVRYDLCTLCYECVDACPRGIIKVRDLAEYVVMPGDLKHGLDDVAMAIMTEKAKLKSQAARKQEDPRIANSQQQQREKLEKALADARNRAAEDSGFAKKLPAVEQRLLKRLEELENAFTEAEA